MKETGFPNPLWKVRELMAYLGLQPSPADPVLSFCRGCDCGQYVFPLQVTGSSSVKWEWGFFSFPWHQICGVFSNTPCPALWHQLGVLQFSSILTSIPGATVRLHRLKAQSHKTALTSQVVGPGYVPGLATQSGFPITPLLRFNNLWEQFTELQRMLYLLLQFIMKDINEQLDEEVHSMRSQSPE